MHPTLFTIEAFGRSIPYYSYGAMLALAFLVGAALAAFNGRREGVPAERVITLSVLILLAAMLGARVLHVLMADNPSGGVLSAQTGGFAFYGGLIGGIGVSLAYCRYHQIPFLRMADTMVPSIVLGQGIGRLGCLLAGCCWGRAAAHPLPDWLPGTAAFDWPQSLALTFMHPDSLAQRGIALVPTQVASSLSCFVIFAVLWFIVRPRKTFVGQQLAAYLIMYPVVRSFWELFRGDPRGLYFGDMLSTSQLVSVPMLGLGIWLMSRGRRGLGLGRGPSIAMLLCVLGISACGVTADDDDNSSAPPPANDDDDDDPPPEFPLEVQVLVTADGIPLAGATVLEGGGPTTLLSDEQGRASIVLTGIVEGEVWVIAAAAGYRSVGVLIDAAPQGDILIELTSIQVDNPDYEFLPAGIEEGESTAYCSHCHLTIADQFGRSAHYLAARDEQVHDLFAGTAAAFADQSDCEARGGRWLAGTAPGTGPAQRCYIGAGLLPDSSSLCGGAAQLACDSPDLSASDQPEHAGACADCHAPSSGGPLGGGLSLLEVDGLAFEEGVTCDFCHKVADIDPTAEPGIGGRTVLGRPLEAMQAFVVPWKPVMYGPYADVLNPYMGGSISPIFASGELCSGCHEYRQAPQWDAAETAIDASRWPSGRLPIHTTWEEWNTSLLAPATPCRTCHMPPSAAPNSADIDIIGLDPGLVAGFYRQPGEVRDHGFYGPTDPLPDGGRLLDTAAAMSLQASVDGEQLAVSVSVSNNQTGHGLPTGEPMRSVVLVVQARCDGSVLSQVAGQSITEVGGALAARRLGVGEAIAGTTLSWPGLPADLTDSGLDISTLRLRVLRDTGNFIDYSGFESFASGGFSAEQKGLPERLPVGEVAVVAISTDQIEIASALPWQDGDLLLLGEALIAPSEGGAALMLAGAPGADFARVLSDSSGELMVPHYRANDVIRDNRLLPYHSASSEHRFSLPVGCTNPEAEAWLLYRRYPPALARQRGWASQDAVLLSTQVSAK